MYKKPLALILVLIMVFTMVPTMALAAKGDVHKVETLTKVGRAELLGGEPQWVFFKQGNPPDKGLAALWTPEELNDTEKEAYFDEVNSKDNSVKSLSSADVKFFSGDQIVISNDLKDSYQVKQEGASWYVCILTGAMSHFVYKEGEPLAEVEVAASVTESYTLQTLQNQYRHSMQNVIMYDVQDFYLRDVQNYYERESQNVFIPMFEKAIIKAGSGTLVAWRNNKTVAGGTFNNGMTYLAIDAAKARQDGYTFGIADSSPNNSYVGYDFHVRIVGNELIISFDKSFVRAEVTAKIYTAAPKKHEPSGHKTLTSGGELKVALPGDAKTYYLFFHLANGISYYAADYHFVDWMLHETKYGANELVNTLTGIPYFDKTETGGPYVADTLQGARELVHEDLVIASELRTRTYTGPLTLTVDDVEQPLDTVFYITPGSHNFVLKTGVTTLDSKTWTVVANIKNTFSFGGVVFNSGIIETSRAVDLDEEYWIDPGPATENRLTDRTDNHLLPPQYANKWLDPVYLGSENPEGTDSIQYGIYTPERD